MLPYASHPEGHPCSMHNSLYTCSAMPYILLISGVCLLGVGRARRIRSTPDLPRGEHVRLAVVLVAPEIAACPADRLRALHAVVIGLAVQADRASPAPGSRSDWRALVRLGPLGSCLSDSWRASLHIKNARLRTAAQQFSSRRRTATPTEI